MDPSVGGDNPESTDLKKSRTEYVCIVYSYYQCKEP